MIAVLADSPSLARAHRDDAVRFAQAHAIPLEIVATAEMENPAYVRNDLQRCFHCKSELFARMEAARIRLGFRHLAYGMNLDDRGDFRPGQQAAKERGVLAPLVDAGLTKADIRELAREAGLQVWDKPASACLSSRIAYGNPVTRETLLRVEQAEAHLDTVRASGALAQYQSMIAARLTRAWIRPPSAHPGISCEVHITQVPGGAVTSVQVGSCNGDAAVRQSIADAAYRASPLPAPPDPALFDRDLVVTFAPNE